MSAPRQRKSFYAARVSIVLAAGLCCMNLYASMRSVEINYPISSPHYPVVLTGEQIPPLLGDPAMPISAFSVQGAHMRPIPIQVDRRGSDGRYEFDDVQSGKPSVVNVLLDDNDEMVFMASDLGDKLPANIPEENSLVELAITDPVDGSQRWPYISREKPASPLSDYVHYSSVDDQIITDSYLIGFSAATPFLLNHLQRRSDVSEPWSPNLVDTMKIRHAGKFLHRFEFVRDQSDYRSKITAVKDGPVRVIRRTNNKVRIVLFLSTPSVEVDFISYRNGFYVDTLLEIPFSIGTFFSNMTTRFSLDWRDDIENFQGQVYAVDFADGLAIDGKMSVAETEFNQANSQAILLSNHWGDMLLSMEIPPDLPLRSNNFLHDDRMVGDAPENVPGQFGNCGYLTSNWEAVDTELHHMMFRVFLTPSQSPAKAMEMMQHAPLLSMHNAGTEKPARVAAAR